MSSGNSRSSSSSSGGHYADHYQSSSSSQSPYYKEYRSSTAENFRKSTVTRGSTVVHNEHSRGYNKNDPSVKYGDSSAYGSGKRYHN